MKVARSALLAAVLAVTTLTTGCFGKFALVRKVWEFNDSLGNKFVKSIVFWAFAIVPVYEVSAVVDTFILNVIEFWTGGNPIAMKDGDTLERVVQADGKPVKLTYADRGQTIRIETEGKSYVMRLSETGAKLEDASGKVLTESRATATGGVEVRDGAGALVMTRTATQVDALSDVARVAPGALAEQIQVQSSSRVAKR